MFLLWKAFLGIHLLDLQGLWHIFLTQREFLLMLFPPTKGWGRNFFLALSFSIHQMFCLGIHSDLLWGSAGSQGT